MVVYRVAYGLRPPRRLAYGRVRKSIFSALFRWLFTDLQERRL